MSMRCIKVGYGNFANVASELVTMATSLERPENEGQIGRLRSFFLPLGENLVEISPVDPETI